MGVLHVAARQLNRRKLSRMLRCHGEAVNCRDDQQRTALMLIASLQPDSDDATVVVMLDTLRDAGADLDLADADGNTALMLGVLAGNAPAVSWLLRAGACPRLANDSGTTPLWQSVFDAAAGTGSQRRSDDDDRWAITRLLLLAGDCAPGAKSCGPLLFASRSQKVYCYEEPVSALDVAVDCGCQTAVQLLVSAGCPCSSSLMMTMMMTTSDDSPDSQTDSWLSELLAETFTLQHLCRLVLRRSLRLDLDFAVSTLVLPARIRSYLLLDNISVLE